MPAQAAPGNCCVLVASAYAPETTLQKAWLARKFVTVAAAVLHRVAVRTKRPASKANFGPPRLKRECGSVQEIKETRCRAQSHCSTKERPTSQAHILSKLNLDRVGRSVGDASNAQPKAERTTACIPSFCFAKLPMSPRRKPPALSYTPSEHTLVGLKPLAELSVADCHSGTLGTPTV